MKRCALFLAFILAVPAFGQDELILKGDLVTVKVAEVVTVYHDRSAVKSFPFTIEAPKGAVRPSWTVPAGVSWTTSGRVLSVTAAPKGDLKISGEWAVIDFDKKETRDVTASIAVMIGADPPPPPQPPVPPPPPIPPPQPVTSFRVILVYESGDTLPGPQNSVLYGTAVANFLDATCTGGKTGWRRRDKDAAGEYDPSLAAVWSAVQKEFAAPKNTKTPAVVVQVNDKIEIIPIAATQAEMIAVLKTYAGVK